MPRVIHFELPADNPERAVKFYTDAFGWKFDKWGGPVDYWLITTGPADQPGINGGLMRRRDTGGVANTLDVASLDDAMAAVEKHGGKIVVPKMAVPSVGWLAYFADTEGNVSGLMQADPKAGV